MGCAPSTDRADQRRRGRASSEAPTTWLPAPPLPQQSNAQESSVSAAAVRRRGCKVAPEPNEEDSRSALPGSPSFRIYCQKSAAVDKLVAAAAAADAAADDDTDSSVRITETPRSQEINKNAANGSSELSKPREANGWLKFRGFTVVAAAMYSLVTRNSRTGSAPPPPPPPAKPLVAPAPASVAAVSHP